MRAEFVLGAVARPIAFQLLLAGVSHLALDLLRPRDRSRKWHSWKSALPVMLREERPQPVAARDGCLR